MDIVYSTHISKKPRIKKEDGNAQNGIRFETEGASKQRTVAARCSSRSRTRTDLDLVCAQTTDQTERSARAGRWPAHIAVAPANNSAHPS